jgi:hypothetical protein
LVVAHHHPFDLDNLVGLFIVMVFLLLQPLVTAYHHLHDLDDLEVVLGQEGT